MIEYTRLNDIVTGVQIYYDPDDLNSTIKEDHHMLSQYYQYQQMITNATGISIEKKDKSSIEKWIIRMEFDADLMLEKNITMDDVNFTLNNCYENQINCVYSDYNADKLVFRIRMNEVIKNNSGKSAGAAIVEPEAAGGVKSTASTLKSFMYFPYYHAWGLSVFRRVTPDKPIQT
jgi:DNA-directed RNA polymerase II subunit RPB1